MIQEYVRAFDVAVDDPFTMEILETRCGASNLGRRGEIRGLKIQ